MQKNPKKAKKRKKKKKTMNPNTSHWVEVNFYKDHITIILNLPFVLKLKTILKSTDVVVIFYQLLGCPKVIFRPLQGGNHSHSMLIAALFHTRPEGHREPRNEIGSLISAERNSAIPTGSLPIQS